MDFMAGSCWRMLCGRIGLCFKNSVPRCIQPERLAQHSPGKRPGFDGQTSAKPCEGGITIVGAWCCAPSWLAEERTRRRDSEHHCHPGQLQHGKAPSMKFE